MAEQTDFPGVETVDFDYEPESLNFYKGIRGETHRISIVSTKDIIRATTHFKEGKGYFLCIKGACCKSLGYPRNRFGAVVVHYRTDKSGEIQDKTKIDYDIKLWFFSDDKWKLLKENNKQFDLTKHDLKIITIEEKYQNLQIQPYAGSIPEKVPGMREKVLKEVDTMGLKQRMEQTIAKHLSAEEINTLLGIGTVENRPDDVDFADVLK